MKFKHKILSLLGLGMMAASAAFAVPTTNTFDFKPVAAGLDYTNFKETNHPWSVHILRWDRSHHEYQVIVTHAKNQITALATVVDQVNAVPASEGTPIFAMNADFFVLAKGPYQGDPLGLQIIDGDLSSAPGGSTFWTEPDGKLKLGEVKTKFTVTWPHGRKSAFGLNEQRRTGEMVLFTPDFGSSTRTTNGMELVLERTDGQPWTPLHAGSTVQTRIKEIRGTANSPITKETAVLSLDPKLMARFDGIEAGSKLTLSFATSPDLSDAVNAVGGRPVLVEKGKNAHWPPDKKGTAPPRHPRTVLGWNDKYAYFMEVDGRQKELSMGMTYLEMSDFMKRLGCTEVINLDGGGSSTFWLNGKVLNSPSDKHERTVANCLVLVKRP